MKSKWIWVVALAAAIGAYLFDNNPGTLTALVCVIVLPGVGMLPLLFAPGLQMELELSPSAEKNQTVLCKLKVSNDRKVPMFGLKLNAQCHNLRTGHIEQMTHRFSLMPRQTKRMEFSLSSKQCGLLKVSMQLESCSDLFDMQRKKLPYFALKELMIMPALFQTHIDFDEQTMSLPDSDVYSKEKPGSDPGEIFAIREYMPGDAIRQIHWKLSEKCDKTMVREFGLQVADNVLVLLETAGATSAEETDAITEVFASVCQELANLGVFFHAGWRDHASDNLLLETIATPGEFPDLLAQLMGLPPKDEGSVAQRFAEQFDQCKFFHVIIVGGQIPTDVQELYNDNQITVLVPAREQIGAQPDGIRVVQFGTETYTAELSALEV